VPDHHKTNLIQKLKALEGQGLTIVIQAGQSSPPEARRATASLEIVGQDRPGIIRQIAAALAQYGVNVEELHTECCSAPMTGEHLFKASIELFIPESCAVNQLRTELEKIAADLMVDVTLATTPPKTDDGINQA
jgi:glycine cleavage system regulatory protein